MVKGQKEKPDEFPKIVTCPNEVRPNLYVSGPLTRCRCITLVAVTNLASNPADGGPIDGRRICKIDRKTAVCDRTR